MADEPRGLARKFTDEELRADLAEGLKPKQIAQRREVSVQAVYARIKQLGLTTTAAAVAPVESRRFVKQQLDFLEELARSFEWVRKLGAACDAWLTDAEDASRYDIGARSEEVIVTYFDVDDQGDLKRVKKPLNELLDIVQQRFQVERTETKHADPRELVLKTAQEVRQTVTTAAELARMLSDARAMEAFREALLAEVAKVSPDVASQIADAVRRSIVLSGSLGGPGQLPS